MGSQPDRHLRPRHRQCALAQVVGQLLEPLGKPGRLHHVESRRVLVGCGAPGCIRQRCRQCHLAKDFQRQLAAVGERGHGARWNEQLEGGRRLVARATQCYRPLCRRIRQLHISHEFQRDRVERLGKPWLLRTGGPRGHFMGSGPARPLHSRHGRLRLPQVVRRRRLGCDLGNAGWSHHVRPGRRLMGIKPD